MAVVFVYGTLTDPDRVSTLLDSYTLGPSACCHGLRRIEGTYPTLAPGEQVSGRLLATPELSQLDTYEGVDRGLYCRVSVPLSTVGLSNPLDVPFAVETVELYVGNPSLLTVSEVVEWPVSGPFEHQVRTYLDTHSVRVCPQMTSD